MGNSASSNTIPMRTCVPSMADTRSQKAATATGANMGQDLKTPGEAATKYKVRLQLV